MQLSDRIGRRLKLQDLHILMTVVQAGSMKKASALLNTSQPAVSRSVAELEQAIGVLLLDRSSHGVEPTEYGRALLTHAAAAFDELKEGVKNIEFLADPTAGEVRIGSTAFLAASFVSAVVDRLSRRHPRIVFNIMTGTSAGMHRELTERNLELLIMRRFDSAPDKQTEFEFLFDDSFVIAAGAGNPLARRRKIELADLVNEPWVLPPGESEVASVAIEAFRRSGLDVPRAVAVAVAPELRMSLLASGRFLSIFSSSVLKFPPKRPDIKILPVKVPVPRAPVGIVTSRDRTLSPVARLFIEDAREEAKALARRK